MSIRKDSNGGVAENITSVPRGLTSVQTSLDRIAKILAITFIGVNPLQPEGRRPTDFIAAEVEA